MADQDIATTIELEVALHSAEVRQDAKRVQALLHPAFVEFGQSGSIWTYESVVATTQADVGGDIEVRDMHGERLGSSAVLLTYKAVRPEGKSLRSSVWVLHDESWRLLHHQGTPTS